MGTVAAASVRVGKLAAVCSRVGRFRSAVDIPAFGSVARGVVACSVRGVVALVGGVVGSYPSVSPAHNVGRRQGGVVGRTRRA